jgi:5-methylcytosine-specific restriction endonuclease McrA
MPIPTDIKVQVFRRDRWMCRWCGCPVILPPVMKYLEGIVRQAGISGPLAYHHAHWTRRDAPLLDWVGAEVDHVKARKPRARAGGDETSPGGNETGNLVTACHKCNLSKGNTAADEHAKKRPLRPVKGKYGEPDNWDGLSTLFVVLAEQSKRLGSYDRGWYAALKTPSDNQVSDHGAAAAGG